MPSAALLSGNNKGSVVTDATKTEKLRGDIVRSEGVRRLASFLGKVL